MNNILAVFIGSGLGGIARYLLGNAVARITPIAFPYGTLAVNLFGCLIIGALVEYWAIHAQPGATLRLFAITGVIGGFTTFSAFTLETVNLLERQQSALALCYIVASVAGGVLALGLGMALARQIS